MAGLAEFFFHNAANVLQRMGMFKRGFEQIRSYQIAVTYVLFVGNAFVACSWRYRGGGKNVNQPRLP